MDEVKETIEVRFKKSVSPQYIAKKLKQLSNVSDIGFHVDVDISKFKKYMTIKNTPLTKGKRNYSKNQKDE
jgi:hypothetical protein